MTSGGEILAGGWPGIDFAGIEVASIKPVRAPIKNHERSNFMILLPRM
jgi:hypothetical protein